MAEEIVINVSPHETRVAVVEQGLLQEIFIERFHTPGTVGNIYKAKVLRILPGLQSAFVDIGQSRAAFMHVTDLVNTHVPVVNSSGEKAEYPPISKLIYDGKEFLVQVSKEPISTKGARATSNISLASRYLVYMPETAHIGISQRIEDEEERQRLLDILSKIQVEDCGDGFIVRTASERVDEVDILQDAALLRSRWQEIKKDAQTAKATSRVFEDLPLHLRVMRDIINNETVKITVDNQAIYGVLQNFLASFIPQKLDSLSLSESSEPLFDIHNLEDQIEAALDQRVQLKSGGYLVIDQTEAMTTVDVNSGAFVGRKDLEETVYRTNLEAAAALPRQLRLRNMGGIVIIDFIDMSDEEHKRQVLRMLEKGQQTDRVKWNITEISELGLVEMTRKRTHESLLKMMCEPCNQCSGKGFVKTSETICLEIFRELRRRAVAISKGDCLIMASQAAVDRLLDEDAECLSELGKAFACNIRLQVESSYTPEQFDIVQTARPASVVPA